MGAICALGIKGGAMLLSIALQGCAQKGASIADPPTPGSQPGTAACLGNAVPDNRNQFRVSVLKIERSSRVKKSAIAVLSQPGQGAYGIAQTSFLIMTVQFENISVQPLAWVSSPGSIVRYKLISGLRSALR